MPCRPMPRRGPGTFDASSSASCSISSRIPMRRTRKTGSSNGGRRRRSAWSRRDVRSALAFLESRGWVTARAVSDRGRLYGANTERLAEIETFLARMEQGGNPHEEE